MDLDLFMEVHTMSELEELFGLPAQSAANKVRSSLSELHRRWLATSPLSGRHHRRWVPVMSPRKETFRGDITVVGEHTIALSDRPGSRRFDGFKNVFVNPHAGLMSLIPGRVDALRVDGRARTFRDAPFFDSMAVAGARPILALVIEADEVFLYHSRSFVRSFVRSGIWDQSAWSPDALPSEAGLARLLEGLDSA